MGLFPLAYSCCYIAEITNGKEAVFRHFVKIH